MHRLIRARSGALTSPTVCCSDVERLTNRTTMGYKESVVIIRARAYCCCCPVALWAPELTDVSR